MLFFALTILFPRQWGHPSSRRSYCKNNLKHIGVALHNYHDEYGSFPPAYVADAHGKPMHSWRVLLLPFLDQGPLYEQYDLSEPWNGPNNSRLASKVPDVFRCPRFGYDSGSGQTDDEQNSYLTNYVAIVGSGTAWDGARAIRIRDIIDGTPNTIHVAEVSSQSVIWTQPQDVPANLIFAALSSSPEEHPLNHWGGLQVLLADGSVRFATRNISRETFDALTTRDGHEVIEDF